MSADRSWKEVLGTRVPEAWGREIDIFETQIELRKKGKIEEKLFAETRLRRGAYGQRYDNGQRHDGEKTQALAFPSSDDHQGPEHDVGRAGHAAHQDPVRPDDRRPARRAGRRGRGVLRPHPARHDAPGHPAPLRAHRGHAGHASAPRRGRASRRARRAATPSATSPRARTPASATTRRSTSRRTRTRSRSSCSATTTRRTSAASSRSRSRAARTTRAA